MAEAGGSAAKADPPDPPAAAAGGGAAEPVLMVEENAPDLVRCAVGDLQREEEARREPEAPYYWEEGEAGLEAPTAKKVWHWTYWGGEKALEGAEFTGEIFANFFGITQSKYQWVIDAKNREEEEKAQKALEDGQRKQQLLEKMIAEEKAKLAALEAEEVASEV